MPKINSVVLNNYVKACGCKSILQIKPQNAPVINPQEIRTELVGNQPWLVVDKTINPEFLQELLKVKGNSLQRSKQIKNKMMEKMGYNPNLVQVKPVSLDANNAAMGMSLGILAINKSLLAKDPDNKTLIPLIRHELAHFEQQVSVVKKYGIEEIKPMTQNPDKNASLKNKILYKYALFMLPVLKWAFNINTKQIPRTNYLNAEVYKNGFKNYIQPQRNNFKSFVEYINNPVEKNAYDIGELVSKRVDPDWVQSPRQNRHKVLKVYEIMKRQNIPEQDMSKTFNSLFLSAGYMLKSKNKTLPMRRMENLAFEQVTKWLDDGITINPETIK